MTTCSTESIRGRWEKQLKFYASPYPAPYFRVTAVHVLPSGYTCSTSERNAAFPKSYANIPPTWFSQYTALSAADRRYLQPCIV